MLKKKNRIYIDKWLELKPYEKHHSTDNYYLQLSNQINTILFSGKFYDQFNFYIDDEDIQGLSCFLTSYLEDLVSETNLWNSFCRAHKELYNKALPFYDLSEYYEEEINIQDISFLIWYYLNAFNENLFIFPFSNFIIEISREIMEVFEEEWEYAPENKLLKTFYTIDEKEKDFYKARNLISTLLFNSYLFYPDTTELLIQSEMDIILEDEEDPNLLGYLDENRDRMLHETNTRLLGFKGKEWASLIIGRSHNLKNDFINISQKILGYFFYKGQDENNVFIEHIASGKSFSLTKKSYDHYQSLTKIDTILFIGIVRWKDEWWFSGIHFQRDFDADLVLDEKDSFSSRKVVSFLDHEKYQTNQLMKNQFDIFKKINDGQQIIFLESEKIHSYIDEFVKLYNDSLELTEKQKEDAIKRARKEGFFGGRKEKKIDLSKHKESGLIFFNPISGLEIAFGLNSAFPMKNNPFYDSEESDKSMMHLLISEEYSSELAIFCINNSNTESQLFSGYEGKIYLENIDFLLRFWKSSNYHTQPTINFTGEPE